MIRIDKHNISIEGSVNVVLREVLKVLIITARRASEDKKESKEEIFSLFLKKLEKEGRFLYAKEEEQYV